MNYFADRASSHFTPRTTTLKTSELGCISKLKSIWACRIKSVFVGAVDATVKPRLHDTTCSQTGCIV